MFNKELIEQNPHLKPVDEENPWRDHLRLGSSNMKKELKRAFPNIKFSVRSQSYSMGCNIRVDWLLGPTTREVNAIINKYQYCHFDGMVDMEEYVRSDWTDTFGGAKYVHGERREYDYKDITDKTNGWWDETIHGKVGRALCEKQKVAYVGHNTTQVYGSNEPDYMTLSRHVSRLLSETSFGPGETFVRLESGEDGYYIVTG